MKDDNREVVALIGIVGFIILWNKTSFMAAVGAAMLAASLAYLEGWKSSNKEKSE